MVSESIPNSGLAMRFWEKPHIDSKKKPKRKKKETTQLSHNWKLLQFCPVA